MSVVVESSHAESGRAETENVAAEKPGAEKAAPAVHVTPKAIQKIRQAFAKMGVQGGLRLGVLGGGCTGLSYQFKFDTKARPNDNVFDYDGVQIFIDPKSILYLKGLTLDYQETLMQSGFVFDNPNATKKCGCGTSFAA
jgi:iron-sulfur cluster assembly protein